jgi:hypothetical protein
MPRIVDVTHADFALRSDTLDPIKITSVLGLEPERSWKQGDPFETRTGTHRRPWGIWTISSHLEIVSDDPTHHLLWLLERLERRRETLADIRRQMSSVARIYVRWNTNASTAGYSLDSSLVARLCEICDRFDITFSYKSIPGEESDDDSPAVSVM